MRFRYTALEEVKMEQGSQRSLIEPMIDRTKAPHKFHVVTKTQSTIGERYYVKEALEQLGFISSGRKVDRRCRTPTACPRRIVYSSNGTY
jgi:hypothetical protein